MRTLERLRQIVHNARRPTDDELMRTAQEFAQMQQRWVDAALEQVPGLLAEPLTQRQDTPETRAALEALCQRVAVDGKEEDVARFVAARYDGSQLMLNEIYAEMRTLSRIRAESFSATGIYDGLPADGNQYPPVRDKWTREQLVRRLYADVVTKAWSIEAYPTRAQVRFVFGLLCLWPS